MSDQTNPLDGEGQGRSADEREKQDCPNLSTLVDWMRQKLDSHESARIEKHVVDCDRCQEHLNDITDDPELPRSGRDLTSHDGSPNFSDEPHFQRMRKTVRKRLTELDERGDASTPDRKPRFGRTDEQALGIVDESDDLADSIGNFRETIPLQPGMISSVAVEQDSTIDTARPRRTLPAEEFPSIAGLRIERQVGQGGFGHVYLAWDDQLNRSVAVKTIDRTRLNSRNRERFFREARSIAAIDHAHVVKVFGVGNTDEQLPYLAMEYVAGGTLYQVMETDAELTLVDVKRTVRYVRDAGLGLQAVHQAGLIHRDLKPANILIDRNVDGTDVGVAKLADFGLVKYLDEQSLTLTRAAELVGTPAYMSPEQASESDQLDARSDVYSLGATLYHAITGQPLFGGSSIAIIRQILESQPIAPRQLNPNIAGDLETVCLRAISKEPAKRYQSADAMTEDLDRFLKGQPVRARKISPLEKIVYWSKQHRGLATTLALLLATLLIGTIASTTLWLKANVAEKQAVADRTVVLDSMTNLVDSLYDDLSNNAASIKSRESVLEAAINGLNSIAQVKTDEQADRTTMLAHRRLGHLMQLKGSLEQAEQYFESALATARSRQAKNSESTEALDDLATATLDLATFLSTSGQDDARVEELQNECRSLLDGILIDEPDHFGASKHIANLHKNRLDAIFLAGTPALAIDEAPEILTDLEKLVSLDAARLERGVEDATSDDDVNMVATDIHFAIGRAHFGLGNLEPAKEHFNQARTFLEKRMQLTPNNQGARFSASIIGPR